MPWPPRINVETLKPFKPHDPDYNEAHKETVRPFRLWDSHANKNVPHRCYATERRALDSALLLVRWERIGRCIEVYDARTQRWIATFKRGLNSIEFTK
jgi:hypothetical protein